MIGWLRMTRIVSFLALVFTALALVPYGAHLFALPNKIGMPEQHYFVAQAAYRGWALLGAVLFPAMALNVALAVLLRGQPGFTAALAACLCMAVTLPVFFAWTYPANVATRELAGGARELAGVAPAMGIFPRRQRGVELRLVLLGRARRAGAARLKGYSFISTCVEVPGPSPVIRTMTSSSLAPS